MTKFPKFRDRLAANEIPLVLAGPILRRVTKSSVSVWIALQEPAQVKLEVFASPKGTALFSGIRDTIELGKNLHVVVVTAGTKSDSFATSPPAPLEPENTYYYDLGFSGTSLGADAKLHTKGVLHNNINPTNLDNLVYPGQTMPSFELPASDRDKLRIMHGSCRKPHGGGIDALTLLDGVLEESIVSGGIRPRPQQLYLTGDQIYADDVADALLDLATDLGDTLLGWDEVLPISVPDAQTPREFSRQIGSGSRLSVIMATAEEGGAGMSSKDGRSHLLSLAEYFAMYLLAWSDAVWPEGGLPDSIYSMADPDTDIGKTMLEQREALEVFYKGLPAVRRALANIPTYMIFDDHEITDDWYIDGDWCANVTKAPLGRRLLRNGLAAYAVFQAWGNDPDQFDKGPNGKAFLEAITKLDKSAGASPAKFDDYLGLPPTAFSGTGEMPKTKDALRWHYTVDWDGGQAVVLDARTMRNFISPLAPAELMSKDTISDQFKKVSQTAPYTIVIVQTPILGHEPTEFVQTKGTEFIKSISENWIIDYAKRVLPNRTLSRWLHVDIDDPNTVLDFESWAGSKSSLDRLVIELRKLDTVICLSGDVHYGFSGRLRIGELGEDTSTENCATIVGLTSSALHNEAFLSYANHHLGYCGVLYESSKLVPRMIPFIHDALDLHALEGSTYLLAELNIAEKKFSTRLDLLSWMIGTVRVSYWSVDWLIDWLNSYQEELLGFYICRSQYFEHDGGVTGFLNLDDSQQSLEKNGQAMTKLLGKAAEIADASLTEKQNPKAKGAAGKVGLATTIADLCRESVKTVIGGMEVVGFANIGEVYFEEKDVIHELHWEGYHDSLRTTRFRIDCTPVLVSTLEKK